MIRCVITDDEPIAQNILESYLSKIPNVHLISKCNNAKETKLILESEPIDLLFLDIQMPEITGLDFLKTLENPPLVIFTTAFSEYALESYELNAIDYLLKPISFDRFETALNKAISRLENTTDLVEKEYFFVKDSDALIKIYFNDILYIEGLKDYVKIIRKELKTIVTLSTMKNMEDVLPNQFKRVHRSYIINTSKINAISGYSIQVESVVIPVGKSYKEVFVGLKNTL